MRLGRTAVWALAFGFAIRGIAGEGDEPALAILLDDGAELSSAILRKTEAIAANVFRQAGVKVRWTICSFAAAERRDPPGCLLSLDVRTVIIKVLPDAEARRWGAPADRLGFSMDHKDVYLLMPGISAVAERHALPVSLVLSHVLVHETGHALLGPGHSQGVMRPGFRKADWRQAEKGQLLFEANDAHRIREALVKLPGSG